MRKASAIFAAALLSGCISTATRVCGSFGKPYIGTRIALSGVEHSSAAWFDLPLEILADTVLLPVDLICMPFTN